MYVRSAKTIAATPGAPARSPEDGPPMICQALGCTLAIPHGHLMCRQHWFEVPLELRNQVQLALDAWLGRKTTLYPYLAVRLEAVIYVGKLHGEDVTALEEKRTNILEKDQ